MTEISYFWDGTTTGDAATAPYDDTEVSLAIGSALGDFVIPRTSNSANSTALNVGNSATVGKVSVIGGAAIVKGILYVSDDYEDVDIASNASGNPRIDRIVLRKSDAGQTVRLTVIQGTPAASPSPPAITGSTDFKLVWIWVPNGYNAAAGNIADNNIHDERVFRDIGISNVLYSARKNLIPNGEFIMVSNASGAPDNWAVIGAPTILGADFSGIRRGYRIQYRDAGAGSGIETTVSCNAFTEEGLSSHVFTLSGYLSCTSGVARIQIYSVNLVTGATTAERTKDFYPQTGGFTSFVIRELIPATATGINVRIIGGSGGTNDFYVSQIVLNKGYMPMIAYNSSEIIWLDTPRTDAAWSATAKSDGSTTINLGTGADFNYAMPQAIRAVMLRVRCRDSGSAASNTYDTCLSFHHAADTVLSDTTAVAVVSCAGLPNDVWFEDVIYVPIDISDSNVPFKIKHAASGAGTLDATVELLGVITT